MNSASRISAARNIPAGRCLVAEPIGLGARCLVVAPSLLAALCLVVGPSILAAGSALAAPDSTMISRGLPERRTFTGIDAIDRATGWVLAHETIALLIGLLLTIVLCIATYYVTRRIIVRSIEFLVRRTASRWDDILVESGVLRRLAFLAPSVVLYYAGALLSPTSQSSLDRLLLVVVAAIVSWVVSGLLTAVNHIYERSGRARQLPIKGYVQVLQIVNFLVVAITAISVLLDRPPWAVLSGLGAVTAILLLIFKDTLLSFVASIQLVTNDMVRIGDWISMPKYEADGEVVEMVLHAVKIQNWDKTITAIPTPALISEPFKNWRGMQESGGRRIKRAILIDQTSVKFLTPELFAKLAKVKYLEDYLEERSQEIDGHNRSMGLDPEDRVSGRGMTNLGTFRMYLSIWLKAHPKTHRDLTFLVRQLDPTPAGLPVEVYLFSNDLVWAHYEAVQADIFDHILAVLPSFELRVFQHPTGHDLGRAATAMRGS